MCGVRERLGVDPMMMRRKFISHSHKVVASADPPRGFTHQSFPPQLPPPPNFPMLEFGLDAVRYCQEPVVAMRGGSQKDAVAQPRSAKRSARADAMPF